MVSAHQHLRSRPLKRGQQVGICGIPEPLKDIGDAG